MLAKLDQLWIGWTGRSSFELIPYCALASYFPHECTFFFFLSSSPCFSVPLLHQHSSQWFIIHRLLDQLWIGWIGASATAGSNHPIWLAYSPLSLSLSLFCSRLALLHHSSSCKSTSCWSTIWTFPIENWWRLPFLFRMCSLCLCPHRLFLFISYSSPSTLSAFSFSPIPLKSLNWWIGLRTTGTQMAPDSHLFLLYAWLLPTLFQSVFPPLSNLLK